MLVILGLLELKCKTLTELQQQQSVCETQKPCDSETSSPWWPVLLISSSTAGWWLCQSFTVTDSDVRLGLKYSHLSEDFRLVKKAVCTSVTLLSQRIPRQRLFKTRPVSVRRRSADKPFTHLNKRSFGLIIAWELIKHVNLYCHVKFGIDKICFIAFIGSQIQYKFWNIIKIIISVFYVNIFSNILVI